MNQLGVIVDGYSTGAGLVKAFSEKGVSCIHVQSQSDIPKVYCKTYHPADYIERFIFEGNLETLTKALLAHTPAFVLSAAECGVELADQLAHELNLPGNSIELAPCRRNKYLMNERVRTQGIPVIPSFHASSLEELQNLLPIRPRWPLIIKPLNSAGGDGVQVCKDKETLIAAYLKIMNQKHNMLGFENRSVIVQEYIEGKEYVVNTVSHNGEHKLCELWDYKRHKRPCGNQIYDRACLIEFNEVEHSDVVQYAFKVMDALGVRYGPAHVEIIKNEKGCFLVELAARLMGANLPFSLLAQCITTPQSYLTVERIVSPDLFESHKKEPYQVKQPLVALFMISKQKGQVQKIQFIEEIRSLDSFFDMKMVISEGDHLHETIDYHTSPGMIYLTHEDQAVIEQDVRKIRKFEESMFQIKT